MQNLIVSAEIFRRFPGFRIGVVIASGLRNDEPDERLQLELQEAQERLRSELAGIDITAHTRIAPWREAYRSFGAKPKQYPSSIENLCRRVLSGRSLPAINPAVDSYNVVSLEYLVPAGGEDLDAIVGDVHLRFAGEDEPPVTLLGESEARSPKPGEVIYADEKGAICRRWNWKEADRTKLTGNTRRAMFVIEAVPDVTDGDLAAALASLDDRLQKYCNAATGRFVLDSGRMTVPLA